MNLRDAVAAAIEVSAIAGEELDYSILAELVANMTFGDIYRRELARMSIMFELSEEREGNLEAAIQRGLRALSVHDVVMDPASMLTLERPTHTTLPKSRLALAQEEGATEPE